MSETPEWLTSHLRPYCLDCPLICPEIESTEIYVGERIAVNRYLTCRYADECNAVIDHVQNYIKSEMTKEKTDDKN